MRPTEADEAQAREFYDTLTAKFMETPLRELRRRLNAERIRRGLS